MKIGKTLLTLAAAILCGSAIALAQPPQNAGQPQGKDGPQMMDSGKMAQMRTDQMVRKYGLDQKQAKKVLRLNKRFFSSQSGRPMGPPPQDGMPGGRPSGGQAGMNPGGMPGGNQGAMPGGGQGMGRPEGRPGGMEMDDTQMEKYNKKLSRILTDSQYKAFLNDQLNSQMPAPFMEGDGNKEPKR